MYKYSLRYAGPTRGWQVLPAEAVANDAVDYYYSVCKLREDLHESLVLHVYFCIGIG